MDFFSAFGSDINSQTQILYDNTSEKWIYGLENTGNIILEYYKGFSLSIEDELLQPNLQMVMHGKKAPSDQDWEILHYILSLHIFEEQNLHMSKNSLQNATNSPTPY